MEDLNLEIITKRLKEFFKQEKGRNLTYLSVFLLVFSVFIIFIIRPTLKTAFYLRDKRESLKTANQQLSSVIEKIVQLNLDAERYRDDFDLLDQAVPSKMFIFSLFKQINSVFLENDLSIENAKVDRIILVRETQEKSAADQDLKELKINYVLQGDFNDLIKALKELRRQRRISIVYRINIDKEEDGFIESTEEAGIKMNVEIKSFFK